jgi:hypothetical protein
MVSVHDFNSAIAIASAALLPQHEIIQERGPCLRGKKQRVNTMLRDAVRKVVKPTPSVS